MGSGGAGRKNSSGATGASAKRCSISERKKPENSTARRRRGVTLSRGARYVKKKVSATTLDLTYQNSIVQRQMIKPGTKSQILGLVRVRTNPGKKQMAQNGRREI